MNNRMSLSQLLCANGREEGLGQQQHSKKACTAPSLTARPTAGGGVCLRAKLAPPSPWRAPLTKAQGGDVQASQAWKRSLSSLDLSGRPPPEIRLWALREGVTGSEESRAVYPTRRRGETAASEKCNLTAPPVSQLRSLIPVSVGWGGHLGQGSWQFTAFLPCPHQGGAGKGLLAPLRPGSSLTLGLVASPRRGSDASLCRDAYPAPLTVWWLRSRRWGHRHTVSSCWAGYAAAITHAVLSGAFTSIIAFKNQDPDSAMLSMPRPHR